MANTGPTLNQLVEWDTSAGQQQTEIKDSISQAQELRRGILDVKAEELDEYTQNYPPGMLLHLSDLLNEADDLLSREVASHENRREWDDRLDNIVQQDEPNARRVAKKIRSLIDRLRVCQRGAAELSQLVERTRSEYLL